MSTWHRVRQFWGALMAERTPAELPAVEQHLSPSQLALFRRMSPWDQRHSWDVFCRLQQIGERDGHLLEAALLHDVGKSLARITLVHRVAAVLLAAVRPGALARLSAPGGHRWLYPLYVLVHHASLGAGMLREAGCCLEVQEYVRRHHCPVAQGTLALLRWADGQIADKKEVKACPESPLSERA